MKFQKLYIDCRSNFYCERMRQKIQKRYFLLFYNRHMSKFKDMYEDSFQKESIKDILQNAQLDLKEGVLINKNDFLVVDIIENNAYIATNHAWMDKAHQTIVDFEECFQYWTKLILKQDSNYIKSVCIKLNKQDSN